MHSNLFFCLLGAPIVLGGIDPAADQRFGVWTYNILDGGFTDDGGFGPRTIYDSATNTTTGAFSDVILEMISPYYEVLAMQELLDWVEDDVVVNATTGEVHPGMRSLTSAWGYSDYYLCKNCDSYRVGFMSKSPIDVLEDFDSGGHGAIAIRVDGIVYVTFHLTPFADTSDNMIRLGQVDSVVENVINKYRDEPLLAMGDMNNPSPLDSPRYSEHGESSCEDSGFANNYCMDGEVDYSPIQHLFDAGLEDLCWFHAGGKVKYNQCANSCTTGIWVGGSGHATAKIDFIFGNEKFLETFDVVHSRTQVNRKTDRASDHYPMEMTFQLKS